MLNILGSIGANVAKSVAKSVASEKKKTQPLNTTTTTATAPTTNEHADYINKNYSGGLGAYTKLQNDRYNSALASNDVDMLNRLNADASRVGYKLTNNQPVQPVQPVQQDYSQQMNDLLSAVKTYKSQVPDMQYPNTSQYDFNGIQKQLGGLTKELQNYKGAQYMNMDEAITRANSQLGGMYQKNMDKAINDYNRNAVSRGMFGQMPTEALKQNAIAENELNKSNAVNSLGANLYSQDFNMAQQKDRSYYNQMNQLADLLGQQYNSELGQYQADVNRYSNAYNVGRQKDQDYFNNIERQVSLLGNKYDIQNKEQQKTINTFGAYSNDYQARINDLKNDNDASNDWQIPYLNSLRNDKIAGQNQAQAKAESESQKQLKELALAMFKELGYAEPWMAEILGINPGQKTQSYTNMLADNARAKKSGGGSSSGGGSKGGGDKPIESLSYKDKRQL